MENNGKVNVMETLKAKVLEFKENWNAPSWVLVALSLAIAIPAAGGWLGLAVFLIGAPVGAVLLILLAIGVFALAAYNFLYNVLLTLDRTYVAYPVHDDEDWT